MNSNAHHPSAALSSVLASQLIGTAEVVTLRRIAAGLATGGVDPDDLVQDAIERALRSWDSFVGGTNFMAWVRTIMQRLAIDAWRRRSRRNHVPLPESLAAPEAPDPAAIPEPSARFDASDVCRALGSLHEPLRSTFRMHALEGRSYLEISRTLGIPVSTVGTRMRRARLRLRQLLETGPAERGDELDDEDEGAVRALDPRPLAPVPVSMEEVRLGRFLRLAA